MPPAGNIPVPDPTALTAVAVEKAAAETRRELEAAITLLRAELSGTRDLLSNRLDSITEAARLLRRETENLRTADAALITEQFSGVSQAFDLRDKRVEQSAQDNKSRVEQSAQDNKTAVGAALSAAKEAVEKQYSNFALLIGKSDSSTDKALGQLTTLIETNSKTADVQITDLKVRFARFEAMQVGGASERDDRRQGGGYILAIAGFVVALVVGIIGIVLAVKN